MKFYHVTSNAHLHRTTLMPQIPKNRMETEESKTARICVSNSIAGCLLAVPRYSVGETLYVYECDSEAFYQPSVKEVPDAPTTGEMWLLEPTTMHFFTKLALKSTVSVFSNELALNAVFMCS